MTAGVSKIRVFVVDDHAVVRLGLRTFLRALSEVELVGEATGGRAALERLDALAQRGRLPHVVLMDLVMRDLDGVETTRAIRARHPGAAVVAVTGFGEAHRVHAALAAGAAATSSRTPTSTRSSTRSAPPTAGRCTWTTRWRAR